MDSTNPAVFGPRIWSLVHTMAATYPIVPTFYEKEQMKFLLKGFPALLPCQVCKNSIQEWMVYNANLDLIVQNRQTLSEFFFNMHNFVNKKLNKPIQNWGKIKKNYNL